MLLSCKPAWGKLQTVRAAMQLWWIGNDLDKSFSVYFPDTLAIIIIIGEDISRDVASH